MKITWERIQYAGEPALWLHRVDGDGNRQADAYDEALVEEVERLRRVVIAARSLKFDVYPAHGSGFVTIVSEGNGDLQDAIAALDAAEIK